MRSAISVAGIILIGLTGQFGYFYWQGQADTLKDLVAVGSTSTGMICVGAVVVGFLVGALLLRKNFFEYVFEKTFHYTREGWDRFTFSFAWFFMFTAVANEAVRLAFPTDETFSVMGHDIDGVSIWILFKILIIMPLSGVYAWYLTRLMQKHRLPDPHMDVHGVAPAAFRKDAAEFAVANGLRAQPIVSRTSLLK